MRTKEQIKEALDNKSKGISLIGRLTNLYAKLRVDDIEHQIDNKIDAGDFDFSDAPERSNKVEFRVNMPDFEDFKLAQSRGFRSRAIFKATNPDSETEGGGDTTNAPYTLANQLDKENDGLSLDSEMLALLNQSITYESYRKELVTRVMELLQQYYEQGLDISLLIKGLSKGKIIMIEKPED